MNITIRDLFKAYKGQETTCPETKAMLDAEYPGWTLDTVVDLKEYLQHHITHGIEEFALVAIFKNMSLLQNKQITAWAKDLLKDEVGTDKEKHDTLKNKDDEMALRAANKLLVDHGKATRAEILIKCMQAMSLIP